MKLQKRATSLDKKHKKNRESVPLDTREWHSNMFQAMFNGGKTFMYEAALDWELD